MVADPGRSRKLVPRDAWKATLNEEESRAYLQSRLVVLSSRMFWSFVAFLAFIELMYAMYPAIRPQADLVILVGAAVGLVALLVIWQGFLVRRPLAIPVLDAIDLIYSLGTGICFALGAYLATDLKPAPYTCLLFTSLMVLTRTILLPSTGKRTLLMSVIAFTPFAIAGVLMSIAGWDDLPAPAILSSVFLVFGVVTLLAVSGSEMVYGLRQRASLATQLGQYTLDRKIAEGGMGVVWLANHVLLRRATAIKLLLPDRIGADTIDRFEREVKHMSKLTHPNTVAIYDYGRSYDGVFYYAMEFLDGIELEALVRDWGPVPAGRVVAILTQVAGALHEAHGNNIIHRDIKPANIILCERGGQPDVAKVVDYGLVKSLDRSQAADAELVRRNLTLDTQSILGTPGYLAPEAITGKAKLGPAVDLYSLGAVGYYLLTGRRVFEGETPMAICIQHVTKTAVAPSKITSNPIPPELETIIMSCLERNAADRPVSADALARLLRKVPASADWDEDKASAWWSDFRKQLSKTIPSAGPSTMDIDLGKRIPSPLPEQPED
jgi:eukaryotic-like serine/threonine-protein kinase